MAAIEAVFTDVQLICVDAVLHFFQGCPIHSRGSNLHALFFAVEPFF